MFNRRIINYYWEYNRSLCKTSQLEVLLKKLKGVSDGFKNYFNGAKIDKGFLG